MRPAMKTTLAGFGSASICLRSRKSASMHSTFHAVSFSRNPISVNRATPIIRLSGAARLANRASVGPIFPPTPRMMRSPLEFRRIRQQLADPAMTSPARDARRRGTVRASTSPVAASAVLSNSGRLIGNPISNQLDTSCVLDPHQKSWRRSFTFGFTSPSRSIGHGCRVEIR